MQDYLIKVTNLAAAKTALTPWLKKDEFDVDQIRCPQWCDYVAVDAYTDTLKPPTQATGKWFIFSLEGQTLPAAALPAIQAQGDRAVGLVLPVAIKGLSSVHYGMTLL